LVALIPALFGHQPLPWLIVFLLGFILSTVPWVLAVASGKIAFRADMAGITLGADPLSWPFRHASAVCVPWADVEGIVLYPAGGSVGWGSKETPGIGIQRRPGAPALRRGNKPARRCPVPGVAAMAVRPVSAWRLDRERLAALTAAVAPAIPITGASTGAPPGVEGPDPAGNRARTRELTRSGAASDQADQPVLHARLERPRPASRRPYRLRERSLRVPALLSVMPFVAAAC
jgi:hypothetical protein